MLPAPLRIESSPRFAFTPEGTLFPATNTPFKNPFHPFFLTLHSFIHSFSFFTLLVKTTSHDYEHKSTPKQKPKIVPQVPQTRSTGQTQRLQNHIIQTHKQSNNNTNFSFSTLIITLFFPYPTESATEPRYWGSVLHSPDLSQSPPLSRPEKALCGNSQLYPHRFIPVLGSNSYGYCCKLSYLSSIPTDNNK